MQAPAVLTLQQLEKLIPTLHIVATRSLDRPCATERSSMTSWRSFLISR